MWRRHEEGVLYAFAVVSYIALGVIFRTPVLNWIMGPFYVLFVVWAIPSWLRAKFGGGSDEAKKTR